MPPWRLPGEQAEGGQQQQQGAVRVSTAVWVAGDLIGPSAHHDTSCCSHRPALLLGKPRSCTHLSSAHSPSLLAREPHVPQTLCQAFPRALTYACRPELQ